MNRHLLLILLFSFGIIGFSDAQTATEAYRYSLLDPMGTARNLGTGNSMFAIGPDFSAIASNPSGLGAFVKSEFLITTGLNFNHNDASLAADRSNNSEGDVTKFNLPNVGFVLFNHPVGTKWNSSNWAVGLNKVADYARELNYGGYSLGSMTDSWRENGAGLDTSQLNAFEEGLAFRSGAIYDFEDDNLYETDYSLNDQYALFKQESVITEGGKSELFIAYGADFDRKISIGISVALPLINYTESRVYEEEDEAGDGVPFFNKMKYTSSVNSTGYGWNAKAAVTIKPTPFLNFALAFHSPTRLRLSDNFNTTLTYDFTAGSHDGPIRAESPYGSFEYALRTPWSASGGIGIIAGQSGFLAAHLKYTDYGSMKYDYSIRGNGNLYEQIEREVNDDIKTTYGPALQLNFGGELVLDHWRIRGGAGLLQSPFNNDATFDPSYHAGAGYRGDHFYIDLGYKLSNVDEGYLPYGTIDAPQPLVVSEQTKHQLAATLGFKF